MRTTLCLTLDLDWAADEVVRDALGLVADFDIPATWFVTHATPVIDEIRAAGRHEIGWHPNFNPLLDGVGVPGAIQLISQMSALAPGAKSWRSHSVVRSSRLAAMMREAGVSHDSNMLIPPRVAPGLWPWRDCLDLVQVPIRWADDTRMMDAAFGEPVDALGVVRLLTVDFHPIHLFLNTVVMDDYQRARPAFGDVERLKALRRPEGSGGARDRLVTLLKRVRADGTPTLVMSEILPEAAS
jgi:hypothetical protein